MSVCEVAREPLHRLRPYVARDGGALARSECLRTFQGRGGETRVLGWKFGLVHRVVFDLLFYGIFRPFFLVWAHSHPFVRRLQTRLPEMRFFRNGIEAGGPTCIGSKKPAEVVVHIVVCMHVIEMQCQYVGFG